MKLTKKLVLSALFVATMSFTSTINAQSTATATTPCGTFLVESEESSISISVNSSSNNGINVSKIFVNGELYKEVTCEASNDVIDFPDLNDDSDSDTNDNSDVFDFGSFFNNFSFSDFFANLFK